MKTRKSALFSFFVLHFLLASFLLFSESQELSVGLWQNDSRFLSLASDGTCTVILKPYYAFLFEVYPAYEGKIISASSFFGDVLTNSESSKTSFQRDVPAKVLQLSYADEAKNANIPCMLTNDGMFFDFLQKLPEDSFETVVDESDTLANPFSTQPLASSVENLQGFWICAGARDDIRLYNEEPCSEVFCWYFVGNRYCRIRYWITDVPYSQKKAELELSMQSQSSEQMLQHIVHFPRMLQIENAVYTCVTLNEPTVGHFETGFFEIVSENTLKCSPIVLPTKKYFKKNPNENLITGDTVFSFYMDSTKKLLALRKPQLVPYDFATSEEGDSLESLLSTHNAKRRPPRKPLLPLMKLDFHWEEIERLRVQ